MSVAAMSLALALRLSMAFADIGGDVFGGGGDAPGTVFTKHVSSGTSFEGTIFCPAACPTSGAMEGVRAVATSFGGQAFTYGWLDLSGTYVVASPAATSGGFKVDQANFPNTCTSNSSCGAAHAAFVTKVTALAVLFGSVSTGIAPSAPPIKYVGGTYGIDVSDPISMNCTDAQYTLDYCAAPRFIAATGFNSTARAITGTVTVNVVTKASADCDSNAKPGTCAAISGGTLCPGANCFSGTRARPGDVVRFVGAGDWETTDQTRYLEDINNDGTSFNFQPALTSNFTGSIEIGYGKILEFDGQGSSGNGPNKFYGGCTFKCGESARVACPEGFCLNVNPYLTTPRTTAGGFRKMPIQGVVSHALATQLTMKIESQFCGRNDAALVVTSYNKRGATSASGLYRGEMAGCGSFREGLVQLQGSDPNSNTDDGVGSMVRIIGPSFHFDPTATIGFPGRMFLMSKASLIKIEGRNIERALQFLWAPASGQNVEVYGLSQESSGICGNSGQPACDLLAARPPFFDIGTYGGAVAHSGVPADFTAFKISTVKSFFGDRPMTFLRVNDPTHLVRIELNGAITSPYPLFDITGDDVSVSGGMQCYTGYSSYVQVPVTDSSGYYPTTNCDRPAHGRFEDFAVLNFDGTTNWTGR